MSSGFFCPQPWFFRRSKHAIIKQQFKGPSTYSQVPRLTSTARLAGEGVRESRDLDVSVGNLEQNQSNVLKETHYDHVDSRT